MKKLKIFKLLNLLLAVVYLTIVAVNPPATQAAGGTGGRPQGQSDFSELTASNLIELNPLYQTSNTPSSFFTPGAIISRALEFAFPLAGLILMVTITWGGFQVLFQAHTKKNIDSGKQRIQAAVIGFILLFVSFWMVKVIEVVFGVNIITYN